MDLEEFNLLILKMEKKNMKAPLKKIILKEKVL